jgi:ribosomal protein S6
VVLLTPRYQYKVITMAETTMPATEAAVAPTTDVEQNSYEFAFHILPTVAEEEVPGVFEGLKTQINNAGGEIFSEEAPERIELAYEIVKQTDGKNKHYGSAYFGWIRFRATAESVASVTEAADSDQSILRHLLIKLTKVEEANPFRYHEHRKADKMVEVFDEETGDVLADPLSSEEDAESKSKEEQKDAEAPEKDSDDSVEEKNT